VDCLSGVRSCTTQGIREIHAHRRYDRRRVSHTGNAAAKREGPHCRRIRSEHRLHGRRAVPIVLQGRFHAPSKRPSDRVGFAARRVSCLQGQLSWRRYLPSPADAASSAPDVMAPTRRQTLDQRQRASLSWPDVNVARSCRDPSALTRSRPDSMWPLTLRVIKRDRWCSGHSRRGRRRHDWHSRRRQQRPHRLPREAQVEAAPAARRVSVGLLPPAAWPRRPTGPGRRRRDDPQRGPPPPEGPPFLQGSLRRRVA